jgi:hypothetical protein
VKASESVAGEPQTANGAQGSHRPQRTGLLWLLERMHILSADEPVDAPASPEPDSAGHEANCSPGTESLQITGEAGVEAEPLGRNAIASTAAGPLGAPAGADPAAIAAEPKRQDALDGFLADARAAGASPRMRNDDIALVLCAPVRGSASGEQVRQAIGAHAERIRARAPKARAWNDEGDRAHAER